MRYSAKLEEYRLRSGDYASPPGQPFGMFFMPGPCGRPLRVIADDGAATQWEHVSVSTDRRIPNWIEMCFVKDLFWSPEECVLQFHPPQSRHVNNYSTCLHLWRYTGGEFPMPPDILVGVKELGTLV